MNSNLNRGAWKTMENNWAKLLNQGCEVEVTITVFYKDTITLRPNDFEIITNAVNPITSEKKRGEQRFNNENGEIFDEYERIVY